MMTSQSRPISPGCDPIPDWEDVKGHVNMDKPRNLVKPTRGLSLLAAGRVNLANGKDWYRLISLPPSLQQIIGKNGDHAEMVPQDYMSPDDYMNALRQTKWEPVTPPTDIDC
jgi:hypothetical protein